MFILLSLVVISQLWPCSPKQKEWVINFAVYILFYFSGSTTSKDKNRVKLCFELSKNIINLKLFSFLCDANWNDRIENEEWTVNYRANYHMCHLKHLIFKIWDKWNYFRFSFALAHKKKKKKLITLVSKAFLIQTNLHIFCCSLR